MISGVENLGDHRLLEVNTGNQNIYIKTSNSDIYENEEIFVSLFGTKSVGSKDTLEKESNF